MDLQDALAHLYGLRPDEFIASRSELVAAARVAKDRDLAKAVGELRKPSVSAWVVNLWARASPDEAGRLTDLGGRLRRAQSDLAGTLLRELSHERSTLLGDLTGAAVGLATQAGAIPSSAVEREVRETFSAALSSPEAAAVVTSGHLTRALFYVGLGEVDLSAAAATPVGSATAAGVAALPKVTAAAGLPKLTAAAGLPKVAAAAGLPKVAAAAGQPDEERAAARKQVRQAEEASTRATELAELSAAHLDEVTARHGAAQERVSELEAELEQAQARLMELTTERNKAARAHRNAQQAAQNARAELEAVPSDT